MVSPINSAVAGKLREMADVLEQQQADGFHVTAYRRASHTLASLQQSVEEIIRINGPYAPGLPPVKESSPAWWTGKQRPSVPSSPKGSAIGAFDLFFPRRIRLWRSSSKSTGNTGRRQQPASCA
jgi:hypothetical protein